MTIRENVAMIREKMDAAARAAGREPREVLLCAATKMNDAARVREAVAAGVDLCGENRVQELTQKLGACRLTLDVDKQAAAFKEKRKRLFVFQMAHGCPAIRFADLAERIIVMMLPPYDDFLRSAARAFCRCGCRSEAPRR